MSYLVAKPGDKAGKIKETAVNRRSGQGGSQVRDEMFTSNKDDNEPERPWLRMEEGNILEAKGRDVSISSGDEVTADTADGKKGGYGWGRDLEYKGMATDAPYGNAGMKK